MHIKKYEELKEKYGHVASWAIWTNNSDANTSDLTALEDNLKKLHVRTIFVALNISGTESDYPKTFCNFHGGKRDFMLRDAIKNTALEGSYITDILKFFPETDSTKVKRYFKENSNELNAHIEYFLQEMKDVGANENTLLIALGDAAFEILQQAQIEFTIAKITHYSAPISKIDYRNEVLSIINNYKI